MTDRIQLAGPIPNFEDDGRMCSLVGDSRRFLKRAWGDTYRQVLSYLSGVPVGRVLDVGAGEGFTSACLHRMGHEVVACDIGIEQFKAGEVEVVEVDLTDPSRSRAVFPDGSFDYVVAVEVLEHMENPRGLLRELARVLRPGGFVVLSTPNIHTLQSRLMFLLLGEWMSFRNLPERLKDESGFDGHISPISHWLLRSFAADVGLMYEEERFSYGGTPHARWLKLPRNRLFGRSLVVKMRKRGV